MRLRALGGFESRIPILEDIADGAFNALPSDRISAVDKLGKYGLGERNELTVVSDDVRVRLRQQVEVITGRPKWTATELLEALDPIWA